MARWINLQITAKWCLWAVFITDLQFFKRPNAAYCLEWQNITMGQNWCWSSTGTTLGPLFFLAYINDLATDFKCNFKLFADYTSIFSVTHNPNECAAYLSHDLDRIKHWAHDWRMTFNPDPAKEAVEVTFSRKKIPVNSHMARENIDQQMALLVPC